MINVRVARNLRELYQAYRLVHDQYAAIELIQPRASQLRFFVRDFLPATTALVAMIDGEVAGTASMVQWSSLGLPASSVYSAELLALVSSGKFIAESTKFACAPLPNITKLTPGKMSVVSTALLRALFHWCLRSSVSDWLLVVHPRVQNFYRDQLGFVILGDERECSHVAGKPGVLLGLDVAALMNGHVTPTELAKDLFLSSIPEEEVSRNYSPYLEEIALFLLSDLSVWSSAEDIERETLLRYEPPIECILDHLVSSTTITSLPVAPLINLFHPSFEYRFDQEIHCQDYRPSHIALRKTIADLLPVLQLQASRKTVNFKLAVNDRIPDELVIDFKALAALIAVASRVFIDSSISLDHVVADLSARLCSADEIELVFTLRSTQSLSPKAYSNISDELKGFSDILSIELPSDSDIGFRGKLAALAIGTALPLGIALYHPRRGTAGSETLYSAAQASQARLRILVVEDNVVQQVLLRRVLSEYWGHDVIISTTGELALETLEKTPVDLILLDIQLPGMDGFEVSQRVRKLPNRTIREIPIYALTSFVLPADRSRCFAAGMDGYLPKPLVVSDLAVVIEEIVSTRLRSSGEQRQTTKRLVA